MTETERTGGCLCGAVTYRVRGEALLAEYCHCGMCRRAAGAPVMAWADFPLAAFSLTRGGAAEYVSSPGVRRAFCAGCGSPLTFQSEATPRQISIAIATLHQPEALRPRQHIYAADALAWFRLSDDLPRHDHRAPKQGD